MPQPDAFQTRGPCQCARSVSIHTFHRTYPCSKHYYIRPTVNGVFRNLNRRYISGVHFQVFKIQHNFFHIKYQYKKTFHLQRERVGPGASTPPPKYTPADNRPTVSSQVQLPRRSRAYGLRRIAIGPIHPKRINGNVYRPITYTVTALCIASRGKRNYTKRL